MLLYSNGSFYKYKIKNTSTKLHVIKRQEDYKFKDSFGLFKETLSWVVERKEEEMTTRF